MEDIMAMAEATEADLEAITMISRSPSLKITLIKSFTRTALNMVDYFKRIRINPDNMRNIFLNRMLKSREMIARARKGTQTSRLRSSRSA